MAINLEKLDTGGVKITKDSNAPSYYIGLPSVLIQVVSPTVIQITLDKGSITLPYASIGTINGDTKPGTILLTAGLLATEVFNTITPTP